MKHPVKLSKAALKALATDQPSDAPLIASHPNSVLTPTTLASMERYVSRGLSFRQAALASGVSDDTWEEWAKKGEAGQDPYRTVVAVLKTAHAAWQDRLVERVESAGTKPEFWQASKFLLQHHKQSREDWGETPPVGGQVIVQVGIQTGAFVKVTE